MLEVLKPGLLSTIQDAGRPAFTALGVPHAGACDPWALAVANLLLGNEPGAAALEITVAGPELRVARTCLIALSGAALGAHVREEARDLPPGGTYLLRAGTTLAFRGGAGARAYLGAAGGIAVPLVLGSASTYLAGGFGGLDGRALREGDHMHPRRPGDVGAAGRRWPDALAPPPYVTPPEVRVVPGPHRAHFRADALDRLVSTSWTVGAQSDRMGLRLQGPPIHHAAPAQAELVSQGTVWGALQVPPDGRPIALLADHQTVGGYPVLAVAIRADRPILAQLPPGAAVGFRLITLAAAQQAYRAQQAALRAAAVWLARDDVWDQLAART